MILFIVAAIVCVVFVWSAASSLDTSPREEGLKVDKEAIVRATVQCYSLEGRYPPSLNYLEQNYGLTLDKDKYVYHYQIIGENLMPRIDLFPLYQ
jgi:hypothetical protein